ncbi:MAG: hypothetical protein ORN20_02620, partial [Candidatus Nanopelagicales bacterium]|nr:hypothetical protein [Candidatus Nanopelagicales bacterium]
MSPWGPYCPTDGAYLEIFGVPPWQPGGAPTQAHPATADSADGLPANSTLDLTNDGKPESLPPIKAEMAGPTHLLVPPLTEEQRAAEFAEAMGLSPAASDDTPVASPSAPANSPTVDTPSLSLAQRQLARKLPWGFRWTRHATEEACTPKPHWWQFRRRICCWSLRKWPLPPLSAAPTDTPHDAPAPPAPDLTSVPMAELPQRAAPPVRATVAVGADVESTGTLQCPRCLAMNEEGHAFCRECGGVLPGAILAPNREPVPMPGKDPNKQRGKKKTKTKSPKKPPRKHDYVAWAVTAGVILLIAAVAFAFFGPYKGSVIKYLRLGYQRVVIFVNPYEGDTAGVSKVTATSSMPGVVPGAIIDGQSTVFWASAPSEDYGNGTALTFTFTKEYTIDRLVLTPGIQNGQFSANALATPASMLLTFDNGASAAFTLDATDASGESAKRQVVHFSSQKTEHVTMTITSVYAPEFSANNSSKYGEVAISEVSFLLTPNGSPFGSGSVVQKPGTAVTSLSSKMPSALPSGMPSDVPSDLTSKMPSSVPTGVASDLSKASESASASSS